MANTGIMPAVKLVAPRYGLENGATVINHGENDQTWGAGFTQENGLCGIKGEFWTWCGAGLAPNTYPPSNPATYPPGQGGDAPRDLDDMGAVTLDTELTAPVDPAKPGLGRWEQVYPFLVQADDMCGTTLHARRPETQKHLLEVLDFLSIKGAERELWTGASNPEAKALSKEADMVGTDMTPKAAIAAVEEAMAACLPGVQGTLHLTPGMAALAENMLHEDDGKLWTFSGSLVIVGAGYAGQSPAGESAVYGTGPVVAHLGPSSMITDELAQMADMRHNEFAVRAERLVAVTFDGCCHVGATVSLT
jgi:hypothetical protein